MILLIVLLIFVTTTITLFRTVKRLLDKGLAVEEIAKNRFVALLIYIDITALVVSITQLFIVVST